EAGFHRPPEADRPVGTVAHLETVQRAARAVGLTTVRPELAQAVRRLRKEGIALSDRRIVKLQSLVAAAAAIDGQKEARSADLCPLILALPTRESQNQAREVLRDLLASAENVALPAAAEDASYGPLARALRIVTWGREVLERRPEEEDSASLGAW